MKQTIGWLAICFLIYGASLPAFAETGEPLYPVVDTGQAECYDKDGNTITCPDPGEAFAGQDAQHTGNPMDYTDNEDGTVTDNTTGLMWEQVPWAGSVTWEQANAYCQSLELGGFDDWRLPTLKELFSISDFSHGWPYLDEIYFSLAGETVSKDEQYWAEPYVGTTVEGGSEAAFGVNHGTGHIKAYPSGSTEGMGDVPADAPADSGEMPPGPPPSDGNMGLGPMGNYVRAVRGNPSYGINDFEDNGDGTVTDHATGLMWEQGDSVETMDWDAALSYAETSTAAGYDDWRLPNIKELQSIVDYTRSPSAADPDEIGPAINTDFFNITELPEGTTDYSTDYGYFWSSTSAYFGGDSPEYYYAWYVAFGTAVDDAGSDFHGAGAVRFDTKYEEGPLGEGGERFYNYVRLVRDVQVAKPGDLNHDDVIDRSDIAVLKQHFRKSSEACPECDLDGDGNITVRDARKLIGLCSCAKCKCTGN